MNRFKDDRGFVAGSDSLFFAFITVGLMSFVLINVWAVIDSNLAVSAAAREGARTYVEGAPGDVAAAQAAMQEVMVQYGRNDRGPSMTIADPTGFERCAVITATVTYQLPLISLPIFGNFGTQTIEAQHRERVDPFRSGAFTGAC